MRPPPFPADLSDGLDGRGPTGADPLAGLDDVAWAALGGAYEGGPSVRALLLDLASAQGGAWGGEATGDLNIALQTVPIHLGTCYETTPPAATFVCRIFTTGGLTHTSRLRLLSWMLWAAGRHDDSILDDARKALADCRPPRPADWTLETRRALAAELPGVFARWDEEPIAVRFGLAVLAGLFAEESGDVIDQVEDVAADLEQTSFGEMVDVAGLLLVGDDDGAVDAARAVAAWQDPPLDVLDPGGLPPAVVARHVLSWAGSSRLPYG